MDEKKLVELRNYLKGKGYTQVKIAEKLGVSRVVVSTLLNGRESFGGVRARRWGEAFGLSPLWLMTGEGDMLAHTAPVSDAQPVAPAVYYAPLITKYAYAGYVRGWGDDEYLETMPKYPVPVPHAPHGEYIAVEVMGDSMDDGSDRSIKEGAVCLCRHIAPELYRDSTLHVNKWVFVIVTRDGILIKRIKEHDPKHGEITISSYNPAYPDAKVELADVTAIYNVVQVTQRPVI